MSKKGDTGKSYHLKCTGDALRTAETHRGQSDLTLFGSCFCPFVQRVWIALEYFGINYQVSFTILSLSFPDLFCSIVRIGVIDFIASGDDSE